MYACLECGKKYRSSRSAEKASIDGCSRCGGVDIDLDESLDDWLEGWERAVLDGQSSISRQEAIRRYEKERSR